jgi:SAM-dependent methyltransferase
MISSDELYGEIWANEEAIDAELARSLNPRATTSLYDAFGHLGVGPQHTVLDAGARDAVHAIELVRRFDCHVVAVDPVTLHVERARARVAEAGFADRIDVAEAGIEALPFDDETFEGATMVSVVHHVDPSRAFPEARRVIADGARFVSADMHPDGFERWWAARFFPSLVELERSRFPQPEALVAELEEAGFSSARWLPLPVPRRFSRGEGLERLRGRAYSTLDRLDESEYEAGLERAERELPDTVEYLLEWALVVGER